jgi:hypothetical protein
MHDLFADRDSNPPPPDLTSEEVAALRSIGVRFGSGKPLVDFKPLPQRPRWLAFLLTLIGHQE